MAGPTKKVPGFLRLMGVANSWRILRTEFAAAAEMAGVTLQEALPSLLPLAKELSVAPVSKFNVGAVVMGESGNVYFGANMEFPSASINASVHAEQCAITNAMLAREASISAIAVTAAPCGHCRQFMMELPKATEIDVVMAGTDGEDAAHNATTMKLGDLLPKSFGPSDLGSDMPDLLKITPTSFRVCEHQYLNTEGKDRASDIAEVYAVVAAGRSHAPYSKAASGVTLTYGDKHMTGFYAENAAFNPSMQPLQVALINARVHGLDYTSPDAVVFAEYTHENGFSHLDTTLATLRALNINAPVTHLKLEPSVQAAA